MPSYRRLTASGLVAIAIVASDACSGSSRAVAPRTTTTLTHKATAPTTTRVPLFHLGEARATASFIPSGFIARRASGGRPSPGHVTGPIPGTTNDAQYFWNQATGQSFVMSVFRGARVVRDAWAQVSSRRVDGRVTYVGSNPITGQREFTWVVGPTTGAFVGGTRMSDDELLRIANSMSVAQP